VSEKIGRIIEAWEKGPTEKTENKELISVSSSSVVVVNDQSSLVDHLLKAWDKKMKKEEADGRTEEHV
jgi:hypothetical protein